MSSYIFTEQQMTTLANNIRSLTGSSETLNISEMQGEIQDAQETLTLKSNVTELVVPEGVMDITANYFSAYPNLKKVTLPSMLGAIRTGAFTGCGLIEELVIPWNNAPMIEEGALSGLSNLKKLTIPGFGKGSILPKESRETYFGYIFGTTQFANSILFTQYGYNFYIPQNLEEVNISFVVDNSQGFSNITTPHNIKKVTFLSSFVTNDHTCDLSDYFNMENHPTTEFWFERRISQLSWFEDKFYNNLCLKILPDTNNTIVSSISTIGPIDKLHFGEGITEIAANACNPTPLNELVLPESLTTIGTQAFGLNMKALTSITLPSHLTTVGSSAFHRSINIYEVYNKSNLQIRRGTLDCGEIALTAKNVYNWEGGSLMAKDDSGNIIYKDGADHIILRKGEVGNSISYTMPNYITDIDTSFENQGLHSITLSSSLTNITNLNLYGNSDIHTLILPSTLMYIDKLSLQETGITSLVIPQNVRRLPSSYNIFIDCPDLNITVDSNNNWFSASNNCIIRTSDHTLIMVNHANFTLPTDGSIRQIGQGSFSGYSGTTLTIPEGVCILGDYSIQATQIETLSLPSTLDSIYGGALAWNESLTEINFNNTQLTWSLINKNSTWNQGDGTITVHCTDGDIIVPANPD